MLDTSRFNQDDSILERIIKIPVMFLLSSWRGHKKKEEFLTNEERTMLEELSIDEQIYFFREIIEFDGAIGNVYPAALGVTLSVHGQVLRHNYFVAKTQYELERTRKSKY